MYLPLWAYAAFMPTILPRMGNEKNLDFFFLLRWVGRNIQPELDSVSLHVFLAIYLGTGASYF